MKTPKICCLLTAIALAQSSLFGVSTDPVGFVSVSVPANSDAVLAVPLNRAAEFKGVIQSISGNVITVAGTPAWTANAFAPGVTANKTYAVQIAGGAKEGMIGRITANGVNTITVTLDSGDDLTNIGTVAAPLDPDGAGPLTAQADQLDIMPYWTPQSLLSNPPNGTEIFSYRSITSSGAVGTNQSPSILTVYDSGSSSWLDQITEEVVNHTPLRFGSAFALRNNSASAYNVSFVGSVPMSKHRSHLATLTGNVDQDIRIGFSSPVPELLSAVNLPASNGDQLFIYDNSAPGKNKSPTQVLVFDSGTWLDSVTESPVPSFQLIPGSGYVYRKFRTANPTVSVWTDIQSYLQ